MENYLYNWSIAPGGRVPRVIRKPPRLRLRGLAWLTIPAGVAALRYLMTPDGLKQKINGDEILFVFCYIICAYIYREIT